MSIPYFFTSVSSCDDHTGKQHREIEAILTWATWSWLQHGYNKRSADIAMKLDRKAFERTRYRSGEKVSGKTEKGGEIKLPREKGEKKISYKNGEVSLNREYRYLSRSTYGVLDITRACIAIDGSENPFWGVVWLMICFARETLRQSGWWRVIICEMINWTEKISREE